MPSFDGDPARAALPSPQATSPDTQTLDQRRADAMCDLLLTGAPSLDADAGLAAVRAMVQVTIPVLTLAGLDDDPAVLAGHGPIDAETARALWRPPRRAGSG